MKMVSADKLSPVWQDALAGAQTIAETVNKYIAQEMNKVLKELYAKYNELEQTIVFSIAGNIATEICISCLKIMVEMASKVDDNECTLQTFYDDILSSIAFTLNLNELKRPDLPGGIKNVSLISKEKLD